MKRFITRAGALAIAVTIAASSLPTGVVYAAPSAFTDIAGHWSEDIINRLAEVNIVNGYPDRSFRPNNKITRAEFAA